MTQNEALEILKSGHNVFVTGAAGSGKTHLVNRYINFLRDAGAYSVIGITASTGIAATHMGGMTVHAWSGIGIRNRLTERDLSELEERRYLWKRLEKARVLVVDEISMLHHFRLDLVERVARSFKRNDKPFGGLQVILSGDFFQLPPVSREGEEPARFAYHSEIWQQLGLKICYLEEQHRQSDPAYLEILNAIRGNTVSQEIIGRLKSRFGAAPAAGAAPPKLYAHNVDVDAENERELEKLPAASFSYHMTGHGGDNLLASLKKSCLAPETLRLKAGARVMFVKNNFEMGYVNGTLGTVAACDAAGVTVKTARGSVIRVPPASWRIEDGGRVLAEIVQYPLRLAWAITIHKSQGMSLDAVEIDLSHSFEDGMGYVALSRVRSLEGLFLLGLNDKALRVHPEAMAFDRKFRQASEKHASELRKTGQSEISARQKEFLRSIRPASGKFKKTKPDTVEETRKLVKEGKSLEAIAAVRKLKTETIVSHIEKLLGKEPELDVSYLKKAIPADRFKKIAAAFGKAAAPKDPLPEGALPPLSPVKTILGAGFSYDEIRLARLFL